MAEKLEECFARIAKMQRQNGRGITNRQLIEEGLDFFRKDAMNGENFSSFTRREIAKKLHSYGAVRTEDEGLQICKGIHGKEIPYGRNGFFYFEEERGKIFVAYSK